MAEWISLWWWLFTSAWLHYLSWLLVSLQRSIRFQKQTRREGASSSIDRRVLNPGKLDPVLCNAQDPIPSTQEANYVIIPNHICLLLLHCLSLHRFVNAAVIRDGWICCYTHYFWDLILTVGVGDLPLCQPIHPSPLMTSPPSCQNSKVPLPAALYSVLDQAGSKRRGNRSWKSVSRVRLVLSMSHLAMI